MAGENSSALPLQTPAVLPPRPGAGTSVPDSTFALDTALLDGGVPAPEKPDLSLDLSRAPSGSTVTKPAPIARDGVPGANGASHAMPAQTIPDSDDVIRLRRQVDVERGHLALLTRKKDEIEALQMKSSRRTNISMQGTERVDRLIKLRQQVIDELEDHINEVRDAQAVSRLVAGL